MGQSCRYLNDQHSRLGLSRFTRYCGAHGIAPARVNDAVCGVFLEDLEGSGLLKNPRRIHRITSLAWNKAALTIEAWPKQLLTVPNYSRTYVLPWTVFPPSLKAEIDAYLDRSAGKDLLADLDFRPLKAGSIATRARQLHEYASALVHRGRDVGSLRSVADLVEITAVRDGLRFFLARSEAKKPKHAYDIACLLKAIANHWVKVDDAHLKQLKSICKNLNPGRGMTEKNRGRLQPFDDPTIVHSLVRLPERVMARGSAGKSPRAWALEVQTALAIELLLMVPVRISNLVGLDLDRHLIRSRAGGGVVHLTIPGAEVKNGFDIEAVLPVSTVRLLDLYLREHRPLLLIEPSTWLFPGQSKQHKGAQRLGIQITQCVKRECGLDVNPHLFRHIAAKIYLDANPGAYGVVRLLHGHKSVATTTQYYCGMETSAAIQQFDEHVLKLRGGGDASAPREPRKGSK